MEELELKRDFIINYCSTAHCNICVLANKPWNNILASSACLCIGCADEAELNQAILLIENATNWCYEDYVNAKVSE